MRDDPPRWQPTRPVSRASEARIIIDYPAAIRELDGASVLSGELRFRLPTTPADLLWWDRTLHSGVSHYGTAVLRGDLWVVGIERSHRLEYQLELTTDGTIHRLVGAGGRPARDVDVAAIVGLLIDRDVIDLTAPANRSWRRRPGRLRPVRPHVRLVEPTRSTRTRPDAQTRPEGAADRNRREEG